MNDALPSVVLLGPQQGEGNVGRVLAELGVRERVALVTAGWQDREDDEAALTSTFGVSAVNLRLHARAEQAFEANDPLVLAYKARQELLRHLQAFYRVRLDYTDDAARAISVRHVETALVEDEWKVSVENMCLLDRNHLERCRAIHQAFEARWPLVELEVISRHRDELRALISSAEAVVIAGGHVASLLNRMRLFDLVGLAAGKPIVAWSAGAMVLTERIVLFHDFPPYGKTVAQVLDAGLGVAPGLVVLPDPQRRLRLDDRPGIARFAQRMEPAICVVMDHGASVVLEAGRIVRAQAQRLTPDGDVVLDGIVT